MPPATSRSWFSGRVSVAHVGKSRGKEVHGTGPAGRPGPRGAGCPHSHSSQPQPSSRLCLGGRPRPPQHTETPGKGSGLATRGAVAWRGRAARTGGRGRWLWTSGTGPGAGRRRATSPAGSWGAGRLDRNRGCPLGLRSASKLGASARAQLASQGPEGGRGQGCATGDRDTGTLIC